MSLDRPRNSSDGIQGLSGNRDFDVVLEARGSGEPVRQRKYVHVIREAWTFTLTGRPICKDGAIRVDVDFHMADPQIDGRMQVTSVAARADRPVTIVHAGRPPVVLPLNTTAALVGTPLGGPWTLTAALRPGESCEGEGRGTPVLTPAVIVSGTCNGVPPVSQRVTDGVDVAARCGNLEQACCAGGACEGGYVCDRGTTDVCIDPQRPAYVTTGRRCTGEDATAQSQAFYVPVRDGNGCGEIASVLADSPEEAGTCARRGGRERVLKAAIRRYDFCRDGRVRVFVPAFSTDDAERCARHLWPNRALEPGLCGGAG